MMLLFCCQVALGSAQVTQYQTELGAFDSRHVPGKYAPRSGVDVKLRDGECATRNVSYVLEYI